MPELPDLEVFSGNLYKLVRDRRIEEVSVHNGKGLTVPGSYFADAVRGSSVSRIYREGKELCFCLSNGNSFSVHLMLNGRFKAGEAGSLEGVRSKIVTLVFDDGTGLNISDFQGMCKVTLNPKPGDVPDALSEKFTPEYLRRALVKNQRMNIKALLINQHIIKGIGNAYADEILWAANISPESVAGKIPEGPAGELFNAIRGVLSAAIVKIRELSPDIISGEVRSFLSVHNSKKARTDDGLPIRVKTIATKTTYFTDRQVVYQ